MGIKKIFIIQISLFIVSILAISSFMFLKQSMGNSENKIKSDFTAELVLLTKDINYKVNKVEENVKSLSSRTMIKNALYSYFTNDISLVQLKAYTQSKYVDGASVYKNSILAVIIGLKGEIIAEYNPNNYNIHGLKETKDISFIETNADYTIYLKNRIIKNNTLIGYDTALFFLPSLKDDETKLIKRIRIEKTNSTDLKLNKYSRSYPIGETGYFLTAELNQKELTIDKIATLRSTIFQVFLLITAVFIISYFTIFRLTFVVIKKLNTTKKNLNDSLTQQGILLKETHHRIKNNFASVGSLLSLQAMSISNTEAASFLEDAAGRINSMAALYEKMLLKDEYTVTSVKQYLDDLIMNIIRLSANNKDISVTKQIDNLQFNSKRLFPIGLIVNECITNIMKYAFTEKDSGIIEVILKERLGLVTLTIQDNGKGVSPDFDIDKQNGFGLSLIRMLTQQLNGEFSMENNKGTKSILSFSL